MFSFRRQDRGGSGGPRASEAFTYTHAHTRAHTHTYTHTTRTATEMEKVRQRGLGAAARRFVPHAVTTKKEKEGVFVEGRLKGVKSG